MGIRLVCSDLDGTLLQYGKKELEGEIFDQIRALHDQGILFCPASGRQYTSLRKLFAPVADQMAFLIENGGGIYYQEKLIYFNAFERDTAIQIARYVQSVPNCEFLADGAGESYALPKSRAFVHQLEDVQKLSVRYIDDFDAFPDRLMKIAVWCPKGSDQYEKPFAERFGHCSKIAVSGSAWIDFSVSDKGSGLKAACELFQIPQERTIAFGDNWNDVSMLDFVANPYIMESAAPALKKRYFNTCSDVPTVLEKIFEKF